MDFLPKGYFGPAIQRCLVKTLGLPCTQLAVLRPVLMFPKADMSIKTEPLRADLKFVCCEACARTLTVQDFLNDAAWQRYQQVFASTGRTCPRRDQVKLEWVRLEGK